jgi:hypothetical protein
MFSNFARRGHSLAACFFLLSSTAVSACTGTVVRGLDATSRYEAVTTGQLVRSLDKAIRNSDDGAMLVCAGERCFPAIVKDDDHGGALTEVMELKGCKIELQSRKDHEETYAIHDAKSDDPVPLDKDEDTTLERKKTTAASVVISAASTMELPGEIQVFANSRARFPSAPGALIKKVKECVYEMTAHVALYGAVPSDVWFRIDFSKLTGAWKSHGSTLDFEAKPGAHCFDFQVQSGHPAPRCYPGYMRIMNVQQADVDRLTHDVQFMLDNGCDASVRGPDPY